MKPININYKNDIIKHFTLSDCIKELLNSSYKIYNEIIQSNTPTTLVCGGQSPAYFCLAMLNFDIYDPELCDIIILPHSKGGQKSKDQYEENKQYSERLNEKNIVFKKNIIILDGVHSGTGINALQSALLYYNHNLNILKYAINTDEYISKIHVNKTYIVESEPLFSDTFPRIVKSFHPEEFNDSSKFINNFIDINNNPIANMIIDLAKLYNKINLDDTLWIQLNHIVTEDINNYKIEFNEKQHKLSIQDKHRGIKFKPINKLNSSNNKIYQCPYCLSFSGTLAVEQPYDTSLFSHDFYCKYKYAIPYE